MPPFLPRLTFLAVIAIGALTATACGPEEVPPPPAPTYVVGTDAEYPPMQFIDEESGEIAGFEIDLMEAIAREGGFEVQWRNIPWADIFETLQQGGVDMIISSVTITDGRRERFGFSAPYYEISQRMVIRRTDEMLIREVTDLDGRLLGVQAGTTAQALLAAEFPHWRVTPIESSAQGFKDLLSGRIFGFMVDGPVAEEYGRANPEEAERYAALPFRFSEEQYGIVTRRGDNALLGTINQGLQRVKEQGVVEALEDRWIR